MSQKRSDTHDVTDRQALALSFPYKVLGDLADANGGVGVVGRNTATTGVTRGVEGRVDSPDGYGLATPDDAKIEGTVDTGGTDFIVETGTTSTTDAKNVVQGHASNAVTGGAVGATVAGGGRDDGTTDDSNTVADDYGTVGGGYNNEASGGESTVGGGVDNKATSTNATVAGGDGNEAGNADATVCGGQSNFAGYYASTLGGAFNQANGSYSTVGGGEYNRANGEYATVAGGGPEDLSSPTTTNNVAAGKYSTVAGGTNNKAYNEGGTVVGGVNNQAGKEGTVQSEAFVGGGTTNEAMGQQSAIVGGYRNSTSAGSLQAFVAGGYFNSVSADRGAVPGGRQNAVSGNYGFAAGYGARAESAGAFVWADDRGGSLFRSDANYDAGDGDPTGANTFNVRSYGGVRFVTGSGTVTYISGGTAGWSNTSTRAVKTNVDPVDPETALAGVESLEVATWEYAGEDGEGQGVRHLGPMAEEFHEAFEVGESERTINSINADGAAFAAIQGLSAKLDARDDRIDAQAERIEALERENELLRERLDQLETRIED